MANLTYIYFYVKLPVSTSYCTFLSTKYRMLESTIAT